MRLSRRVLPAIALALAALAPQAPASADDDLCMYFKWNREAKRWELVAYLQPQSQMAGGRGTAWDCEYCYGQLQVPEEIGELVGDVVRDAERLLGDVGEVVGEYVTTSKPWRDVLEQVPDDGLPPGFTLDGPDCPKVVPPLWYVASTVL